METAPTRKKGKRNSYYAVAIGHRTGVFTSWNECQPLVHGYPGAIHQSFSTLTEASEFVTNNRIESVDTKSKSPPSSPKANTPTPDKTTRSVINPYKRKCNSNTNINTSKGKVSRYVYPIHQQHISHSIHSKPPPLKHPLQQHQPGTYGDLPPGLQFTIIPPPPNEHPPEPPPSPTLVPQPLTPTTAIRTATATHANSTMTGQAHAYLLPHTPPPTHLPQHNTNITFGDSINQPPLSACRILFQNINGMQEKAHDIGARAKELHIDIIGLVETNTDWAWKDIKATTTNILRRYFPRTTFAQSSSAIQFQSPFQPGGTMTIAGGKWGTRSNPSSDPRAMGRWSAITIIGRLERRVTIFSVYRVCDQRFASSGIKTAFRQQFLMAADLAIYPNEPRKLLLKDLGNAISHFREQAS